MIPLIALLALSTVGAHAQLAPIQTVTIDEHRAFRVNDAPFFPIMIWLQDPENFDRCREAGANCIAGYWPRSGGTQDVVEYMERVKDAGFYGVMPFHEGLVGNPNLLGYIHDDEPDKPHQESAAEVIPSEGLHINEGAPLWKIVDGGGDTWSVIDPLEGAAVTIRLKAPVTVRELAVWVTVSPGLAVARDVRFVADGEEIAKATLEAKRGRQRVPLGEPATSRELTLQVDSTYPGDNVWGSIGEIEGFDDQDSNLLLSKPRQVPEKEPEAVLAAYQRMRDADPSRPVFLTLTANFMPHFNRLGDELRLELYPRYIEASDVVGFDIYPLYGWGRADWIHLVSEGGAQLTELAGTRPTYQWIETSKGSQWVGEANQPEVTPKHIRAEVWMAICRGATAIGYFTHIWKPSYKQFGTPDENVAEMRRINDQITRLAPAIFAPAAQAEVSIAIGGGARADIIAKQSPGNLHIFAVNCDENGRGGSARIEVGGIAKGTSIEVVDENRRITCEDGYFMDDFDNLEVHIYRVEGLRP